MADGLIKAPSAYVPRSEIPRASTFVDPGSVYTTLFALVPGDQTDPDPLNRLDWLDPLDPRFTKALDSTNALRPHVYHGEPITTIAHQHYGKTSPWWLILAFNGYSHPDEVPKGAELEIPDLDGFLDAFNRAGLQARKTIVF